MMVFHWFSVPSSSSATIIWEDFFYSLADSEIFAPIDLAWGRFIQSKFPATTPVQIFTAIFLSHLVGKNHLELRLNYWAEKSYPLYAKNKIVTFPTLKKWMEELETANPILIQNVKKIPKEHPSPLMILEEDALYLGKYYMYQQELASWFIDKKNTGKLSSDKDFQIITGGPGTGKTTQVFEHILEHVTANSQSQVGLLAPTGKAAQRLSASIMSAKINRLHTVNDELSRKHIQSIPDQAITIHRFLSEQKYLNRDRYIFNARSQVQSAAKFNLFGLIVLDEASMISVPLFHALLPVLTHTKKIILLGDKDQLSSVEEGSLFYDLVTPIEVNQAHYLPLQDHIIFLTKNYRYSDTSGIAQIAESIATALPNKDNALKVVADIENFIAIDTNNISLQSKNKESKSSIQSFNYYPQVDLDVIKILWQKHFLPHFKNWFQLVEEFSSTKTDEDKEKGKINDTQQQLLNKLFQLQEDKVILTAKRTGPFGVGELNRLTQEWLTETGFLLNTLSQDRTTQPGMTIIMIRNRYDIGLYNGDIGIMLEYNDSKKESLSKSKKSKNIKIFFSQGEQQYFFIHSEQIVRGEDYEIAFAVTVHKSQGSEYNQVMVVMDNKKAGDFITREMCYTAITRAKERVFFLMERDALVHALAQDGVRHSGIKRLMAERDRQEQ